MKELKKKAGCGTITEQGPILEIWCDLNKLYLDETRIDCPWWYNERASISIIAAAAWKSDHIALEEFSTPKIGRKEPTKDEPGRCDLKIKVASEDLLFEAKQSWPWRGCMLPGFGTTSRNKEERQTSLRCLRKCRESLKSN